MSTRYMNSTYVNIFTNLNPYWLASRCVDFNGDYGYFRMFYVSDATVGANYLYGSNNNYNRSGSNAVRPVVEIDRTSVTIGRLGDGSRNSQYSIEAK